MKREILGVKIDDISIREALQRVARWLKKDQILKRSDLFKMVVTPGPEFLVTAQTDPEFKKILNKADLALPDGFGLNLWGGIKNRVPGTEFMLTLCRAAAENNWTIGLFGGQEGAARETASKLRLIYPNISIRFAVDGREADKLLDFWLCSPVPQPSAALTGSQSRVSLPSRFGSWSRRQKNVDFLFVALGHPKQEKFLWKIRERTSTVNRLSSVYFRVGMGVGGSFDFISGRVWEPPAWLGKLGLRWLGRLISRPKYMLPKIIKAVTIFPLLLIWEKLQLTKK